LEFTHAARAGEGKAHEIATNSKPSVTPMLGMRIVVLIPYVPRLRLEKKSTREIGSSILWLGGIAS
jgi:hypothetical protein